MSAKPILVDGWNPFHEKARYGLPATFGLLFFGYVVVANYLKSREPPAPRIQ